MRFQNLLNVIQWIIGRDGIWTQKIWPQSPSPNLFVLRYVWKHWTHFKWMVILILVRTTPTGEDENRARIHWAKNSTSSLKSTTLLARCQASWRREMEWHVLWPSQSRDCLPMLFFKAKCLCCQERVCLSLGDSGCQDWENSKHVKNSSASRLRGCSFLLKCRLCSRQRAGVCLCSLQPAAETA